MCFIDVRGRDNSSDKYPSRGNNINFYTTDRGYSGPRNTTGSSIGLHKTNNSGRSNANDRPAPVVSTSDGFYADGDYGWGDDDPSNLTVPTKAVAAPIKNNVTVIDKDKCSAVGPTDPIVTRPYRNQRKSLDRDSNSSAECANARRRRRTKVNNHHLQACK